MVLEDAMIALQTGNNERENIKSILFDTLVYNVQRKLSNSLAPSSLDIYHIFSKENMNVNKFRVE